MFNKYNYYNVSLSNINQINDKNWQNIYFPFSTLLQQSLSPDKTDILNMVYTQMCTCPCHAMNIILHPEQRWIEIT